MESMTPQEARLLELGLISEDEVNLNRIRRAEKRAPNRRLTLPGKMERDFEDLVNSDFYDGNLTHERSRAMLKRMGLRPDEMAGLADYGETSVREWLKLAYQDTYERVKRVGFAPDGSFRVWMIYEDGPCPKNFNRLLRAEGYTLDEVYSPSGKSKILKALADEYDWIYPEV